MEDKINQAVQVLKRGGLVIFPSDTVYGALVDATNELAVKKLINFKARPPGKPISVFVKDLEMLNSLVEVDDRQNKILHEILPGPFTVILKSKHKTVNLLESERGSLGIRLPISSYIEKLIKRFKKPITATSANLSGYPPHYSIESLMNRLPRQKKELIDYVVDTGKLPHNKPSAVIDLTESSLKIIRQGELGFRNVDLYLSKNPDQTRKISQFITNKLLQLKSKKPIIFIIKGELGAGKTIFVKGVGDSLNIKDIISPSYVIYYEYPIQKNNLNTLVHADFYNIEEPEELKHLGFERFLTAGKIICIEWGEKAGDIMNILKSKGEIIFVEMGYISANEREIKVSH